MFTVFFGWKWKASACSLKGPNELSFASVPIAFYEALLQKNVHQRKKLIFCSFFFVHWVAMA